jgi:hypothetical protein
LDGGQTCGLPYGSLSVSDTGEGVNIAPPNPAASYHFTRTGNAVLPDESNASLEGACSAEFTFDRGLGMASLKLPRVVH